MLVVITQSAKGSRNDENDSIDKAKCAAISKRSEHEESAKETKAGTPMDVYNMCIFINVSLSNARTGGMLNEVIAFTFFPKSYPIY